MNLQGQSAMYRDPIIVCGVPRSRTSLTMQLLQISGLFLGKVSGVTKANPYPPGQLENVEIINKVVKPELRANGYDPKGQYPIPPIDFYDLNQQKRQQVLSIMKSQGLKEDQKWGIKLCKAVWNYRGWLGSFPNATWIIVRRKDEDIVKSCLSPKAAFMDKYNTPDGWRWWVNEHKKRFELIKQNCTAYELDTDAVINKDFTQLKTVIKAVGLKWKPDKVEAQIKP